MRDRRKIFPRKTITRKRDTHTYTHTPTHDWTREKSAESRFRKISSQPRDFPVKIASSVLRLSVTSPKLPWARAKCLTLSFFRTTIACMYRGKSERKRERNVVAAVDEFLSPTGEPAASVCRFYVCLHTYFSLSHSVSDFYVVSCLFFCCSLTSA